MNAIKQGNKYLLRIDKNEEVLEVLTSFCKEHNITLANVSAIGAASKVKVGLFDVNEKEYISKEFEGIFEITNITGNVTTMNDEVYLHLHINFSDRDCNVYGGHLNTCVIGATCEVILDVIDAKVDRKFSTEIGLNLLEL